MFAASLTCRGRLPPCPFPDWGLATESAEPTSKLTDARAPNQMKSVEHDYDHEHESGSIGSANCWAMTPSLTTARRLQPTAATNGSRLTNRMPSFLQHRRVRSRKLLKFASSEKIPVTARGAGYGYVGGCVPARGGIALSLSRMNRIKEISFADAVAIVEPGVITADLKAAVRAQKLFYPPDPASMKDCSIGGNVATNAGGPRCLKYGVTRNYIIGLEVVLANGEVLRTGGRVHKNKTGFDLIGLFVGSEGMLGVVTEITVRLLPLPPARATLSASFATMSEAAEAVQAIFAAGFLAVVTRDCGSFHVGSGAT